MWQQAIERKNRSLKAIRHKTVRRDVMDLIGELQEAVRRQELDHELALLGKGQFRLSSACAAFLQSDSAWNLMSAQEKQDYVAKFSSHKTGM